MLTFQGVFRHLFKTDREYNATQRMLHLLIGYQGLVTDHHPTVTLIPNLLRSYNYN